MQPLIRLRPDNDPTNMDSQAYMPLAKLIEVTISGSDPIYPWLIPAGTYVEKVLGRIVTAISGSDGTIDVGDEDTAAKFIANNEWTEQTANQIAVSTQTTIPDGAFYPAAKKMKITPSASVVSGKIQLLIVCWELGSMTPNKVV